MAVPWLRSEIRPRRWPHLTSRGLSSPPHQPSDPFPQGEDSTVFLHWGQYLDKHVLPCLDGLQIPNGEKPPPRKAKAKSAGDSSAVGGKPAADNVHALRQRGVSVSWNLAGRER